jgi:hypothetical protein
MGNWGINIEDSDTYLDVEAEFLEQLSEGISKKEIYHYFLGDEDFEDISEETHDWWFAIADLFWKIGYLDKKVFKVVKTIIETKADLEYWRDCDADEEDILERADHLNAFLNKISTPIETPMQYDDFAVEENLEQIIKPSIAIEPQEKDTKKSKEIWDKYTFNNLFESKKTNFFLRLFSKNKPPTPPKKPCFLAGTLVKTQEGYKNIENLKEGEKVWSYNIKTGQTELQPILQTYSGMADKYVKITTTQGQILEATGGHRFYIPLTKKWKEAATLSLGDYFYNPFTDQNIQIQSIERIDCDTKTYNIQVAQNHNYMVSNANILTHNNGREFKYNSTDEFFFEFYTLNDRITKKPKYGGITIQELTVRFDQHFKEGKRALEGIKPYYDWKLGTEISSVVLKDTADNVIFASKVGGVKMTFFEARVIEQYILNYYGGALEHKGLGKLLNRSQAMSKEAFIKYKSKFNPCRFFV